MSRFTAAGPTNPSHRVVLFFKFTGNNLIIFANSQRMTLRLFNKLLAEPQWIMSKFLPIPHQHQHQQIHVTRSLSTWSTTLEKSTILERILKKTYSQLIQTLTMKILSIFKSPVETFMNIFTDAMFFAFFISSKLSFVEPKWNP